MKNLIKISMMLFVSQMVMSLEDAQYSAQAESVACTFTFISELDSHQQTLTKKNLVQLLIDHDALPGITDKTELVFKEKTQNDPHHLWIYAPDESGNPDRNKKMYFHYTRIESISLQELTGVGSFREFYQQRNNESLQS